MLICRIDKAIKNLHEALPAKYICHLNRQITLTLTPCQKRSDEGE